MELKPRVTTGPICCPGVLSRDAGAIKGLKLGRLLVNVNFIFSSLIHCVVGYGGLQNHRHFQM